MQIQTADCSKDKLVDVGWKNGKLDLLSVSLFSGTNEYRYIPL